jgi:phage tail-like protein
MAVLRDHPYSQFNFLVDLGTGDAQGPQAGFAEVSGLTQEVQVIEYRTGNARDNHVQKISGLTRCGNVTLRRGVIGSLDLVEWLRESRNGNPKSGRQVVIHLMPEDQAGPVMSWRLRNARVLKHASGPFNAKGTDVAMEELVLACEAIDIE